jgi:hypothetical protein
MRRRKYTAPPPRAAFMFVLIWPLLCLCAPRAGAQEFRIKVLNGRNGKPITKECLNIWVGTLAGPHLVAATNRDGVVVLRVSDDKLVAEAGCQGWPVQAAWPTGSEGILVTGDYYVACQEYAKVVPNAAKPKFMGKIPPLYPVKEILEPGISASNTCGKFRAKPKPGELIFFVRPPGFWEKMRQ